MLGTTTFETAGGGAAARPSRELMAVASGRPWLNASPRTEAELLGRPLVVQFCTYTCINWLRTIPWMREWAQAHGADCTVVGVHTPEFGFERDSDYVRQELERLGITHPIVIDDDYKIWRAFDNHYWPALYIFDARGRIRHRRFGEGGYDEAERVLVGLLVNADRPAARLASAADRAGVEASAAWDTLHSPENYLGYQRTERFASPGGLARGRAGDYNRPTLLGLNEWALLGRWIAGAEAVTSDGRGVGLSCRFHARDLHLVMGPRERGKTVRYRVQLDGQPPGRNGGQDVDIEGYGVASAPRLYQLIRQRSSVKERLFEVEFLDLGIQAFAFTFG